MSNEQNLAVEVSTTPAEREALGKHATWMHEATRNDGARLYTSASYRHTIKGDWSAKLILADGTIEKLARIPAIRLSSSKLWKLTSYGQEVREEGRI